MANVKIDNASMAALAYDGLSPVWQNRIPSSAAQRWNDAKLIWTADTYAQARLEAFASLVMRIGLTTINDLETTNPLAIFDKSEGFLYGDVIQEMGTDVIKGEDFADPNNPNAVDGSSAPDQFMRKQPKVDAAYHKINRQMRYETTLWDPDIRKAFLNEGGLSQLFSLFIKRLYDSNKVDRYLYFKRVFADIFNNRAGMALLPSQIIGIPDIRDMSCTPEDTRKAILIVKNALSQLAQNYKGFNQMGYTQAVARTSMASVIDFKAKNQNITQNLPLLFNPEYSVVDIAGEIEVDNFGEQDAPNTGLAENLIWAIVDKEFIQSRKTLQTLTNAVNARGLYANFFLHDWEIFYASPFKSALFFVPETQVDAVRKVACRKK